MLQIVYWSRLWEVKSLNGLSIFSFFLLTSSPHLRKSFDSPLRHSLSRVRQIFQLQLLLHQKFFHLKTQKRDIGQVRKRRRKNIADLQWRLNLFTRLFHLRINKTHGILWRNKWSAATWYETSTHQVDQECTLPVQKRMERRRFR